VRGQTELATLASSFNEMAGSLQVQFARLESLSRMQQRFVSDVSHELRTPLTTIQMAAEVIGQARDTIPDPAIRRAAELLDRQIKRFSALLADLLEISRFDALAARLDTETTDLRDVLDRVIDQFGPLAESKGVELQRRFPAAPVTAELDPRRIERVARNLVANAIEYAEGQPVVMTLAAGHGSVALTVEDHGTGMTPDQLPHVFDRFWRADPARTRTTGGTGLGLSIAHEDALLHGGRLDAWSAPGAGTQFRLWLPVTPGGPLQAPPLPLVPNGSPHGATVEGDRTGTGAAGPEDDHPTSDTPRAAGDGPTSDTVSGGRTGGRIGGDR
jgi:two-component system sensor histidine kinase MtrB